MGKIRICPSGGSPAAHAGSFAGSSAGEQAAEKQCFETSAMLITFILAGKALEASARGKASEAMSALLHLQPPTALVWPTVLTAAPSRRMTLIRRSKEM